MNSQVTLEVIDKMEFGINISGKIVVQCFFRIYEVLNYDDVCGIQLKFLTKLDGARYSILIYGSHTVKLSSFAAL